MYINLRYLKFKAFYLFAGIIIFAFLFCYCNEPGSPVVSVTNNDSIIAVNNGIVKCEISKESSFIVQSFYAAKQDDWELIARSFYRKADSSGTNVDPLYARGDQYDNGVRLIASEGFKSFSIVSADKDEALILLLGKIGDHEIEENISLKRGQDFFHIEVEGSLSGTPDSWQRVSFRCSPLEPTILPDPVSKTLFETNMGDIFSGP